MTQDFRVIPHVHLAKALGHAVHQVRAFDIRVAPLEVEIEPVRAFHDIRHLAARRPRKGEQVFVHLLGYLVIGLHDADPLARRDFEPTVDGMAVTAIGLVDHDDTVVFRFVRADDIERVVGGPVVHADNLDIVMRLCKYGIEAFGQVFADIVNWDDHRYLGIQHCCLPFVLLHT